MFDYKRKLEEIPKSPGIYKFLNKDGVIIYIGKAKNLKSRVSQYFTGHDNRPQLPFLMAEATDVNYTVVSNELESAFLENTLIKQYSPKFNIDLKDDKNYAFITIDYSTEIPQIGYVRKLPDRSEYNKLNPNNPKSYHSDNSDVIHKLGSRYFGPYSAVYKIRNTLNLVRRVFPYCAAEKVGVRPCFYYYMHRCPGACIGKISLDEYKTQLERISEFLGGNSQKIVTDIKKEMSAAAKNKKFERAARLRDSLHALEILTEKQNVIMPKKVNWDLISIAESDGYACINLFKVREGKLYDKENFVYSDPDIQIASGYTDSYRSQIIQRFLEQYYLETSSRPSSIYLDYPAEDLEIVEHIIRSRFNKKTEIALIQKGKTKKLLDLGKLNAEEYLRNWLKDKAGNLDKINTALNGLKDILNLPQIPKRIECYDNSNIQGTNPVGSMVVFVDGLPAKSQYRKFKFTDKKNPPAGGDDFAMMKEMLTRRLARSTNNNEQVTSSKNQWPLPDLIVIDGGKGQLSAACEALSPSPYPLVPIIGLAKRIEEIFLPNNPVPVILDHRHPSLQLLQRLRDEAHRFGITFHRDLRSKQATRSALDEIPGIGPKTKKLLKTKFGTITQIKSTPTAELAKMIGQKLADQLKKYL